MNDQDISKSLVAILSDLIAIPSPFPPGESKEICAYTAEWLRRAGYKAEIIGRKDGVDNVVAEIGSGTPNLVFNAHVDTVGVGHRSDWRTNPFKAHVENGQVFGLGAGNCKGSMAVHLWLAGEIMRRGGPKRGRITFTFVGDEENLGPDGMYYLRESGRVKPDMLVLGAQTENQLIAAERGVMWANLSTKGRAAHAGNPSAGDNAILRLVRLVNALERELIPRLKERRDGLMQSTNNLGILRGGHNTNVVPSAAIAEFDRRLLPSEKVEAAFAEMKEILARAGEPSESYAFTLERGTNGFRSHEDGELVQAFTVEIAARLGKPAQFLNATGVSDGRYFADDAIPILNFGPGSGAQGHAANESVPIDQMVDAARIQLGVVQRLCQVG